MAVTRRHMTVPPETVFAVLRDGWSYGGWVVGTRAIRAVDPSWPEPGSNLHYTVGYGPFKKEDRTESIEATAGRHLELRANAWPAGSARIEITLEPVRGGTLATMDEVPQEGLARLVHNPILDMLIKLRNVEALRRLERLARERAGS